VLAGMGWLTPVLGALLHMLAATFVIFNSARLVRFGEELHRSEPQPAAPGGVERVKAQPIALQA